MKAINALRLFLLLITIGSSISLSAQRNPVSWEGVAISLDNGKYKIEISAKIQSGWYVYSQKLESDMGPVPTSLEFTAANDLILDGEASEKGNRKEGLDKAFGMNVVKYLDNVTFTQMLSVSSDTKMVQCIVTYMTCNGELCLPPKDVPIQIGL